MRTYGRIFLSCLAAFAPCPAYAGSCGYVTPTYHATPYVAPVTQVLYALPVVFLPTASFSVGLASSGIVAPTLSAAGVASGAVSVPTAGPVAAQGVASSGSDQAAVIAQLRAEIASLRAERAGGAVAPAAKEPADVFEAAVGGSCIQCHGAKAFASKGGGLNLEGDWSAETAKKVAYQVASGLMPPPEAKPLAPAWRKAILDRLLKP